MSFYDYSKVVICKKHGTFYQTYHNHINGTILCQKCSYENKYDYSKTVYRTAQRLIVDHHYHPMNRM